MLLSSHLAILPNNQKKIYIYVYIYIWNNLAAWQLHYSVLPSVVEAPLAVLGGNSR